MVDCQTWGLLKNILGYQQGFKATNLHLEPLAKCNVVFHKIEMVSFEMQVVEQGILFTKFTFF